MINFIKQLFGMNSDANITVLDKATFKEAIVNTKVQLVDVRTPSEYSSGNIKTSKNINIMSPSFNKDILESFDASKPIYLYCKSGMRSRRASNVLSSLGFTEIYDLEGGFMNWSR